MPQPGSRAPEATVREVPRVVELFAGAGGLGRGLHRAGFKPALVVDSDERAFKTLKANKRRYTRGWRLSFADVATLDYAALDFKGVDLVSAGAPCQPFSAGGRLRGEGDPRNMFPEVVRAVRELRPRSFLFENVRGLLFPRVRPYFDYIINQLRMPSLARREGESWRAHNARLKKVPEDLHEYRVYWRVLNAADYGLAQYRPRLVVVGFRADEAGAFEWPEPSHSREKLVNALHEDEYWDEHEVSHAVRESVRATHPPPVGPVESGERVDRWLTLRDVIADLGPFDGDPLHSLVPGARLYSRHTGSSLDWPAKTVKAGVNGCPGGEHIVLLDDGSHRYLSVRECAALQGFPRDYNFPHARTYAMRQIGNAVPLPLAETVGGRVMEVLNYGET